MSQIKKNSAEYSVGRTTMKVDKIGQDGGRYIISQEEKNKHFAEKKKEDAVQKGDRYKPINNAPFRITIGQQEMIKLFRSIFSEEQILVLSQKDSYLCIQLGVNNKGRVESVVFLFPKRALPVLDVVTMQQLYDLEEKFILQVRTKEWDDIKYGNRYGDHIGRYFFEDIRKGKFRNEFIE